MVAGVGVAFVAVNHILLAALLWLRQGLAPRASGLFDPHSAIVDLSLGAFGVALAALWTAAPWLIVGIVAPLGLAYRVFRVHALLGESEDRFRTLFDAAPLGMAVHGLDGAIISENRALRELLGDRDPRTLLTPADAHHLDELNAELIAGARPGYSLEQRYRLPNGDDVFTQVDTALVRDAAERPRFLISMTQDVTSRRRLEDQLAQSQKMDAIGRLAGGVAHDFNNLLTAIRGYVDFARGRVREDDHALRADLAEIDKAAERANQLTRQLLAFGRKQLLEPQVLNLNDVVCDTDAMLRRLIGENIEVVTDYGAGLGRVLADPGQLHQVIVNLVVNARDEMPDGGMLTIETANRTVSEVEAQQRGGGARAGSFVTLAVRDTGRGMDAATRAHLFEPFFTRKEVGKGTGLGLATVDGIVSQSGGFVGVESEPGRGATFTIFLPSLGAEAETALPSPEPVREPSARGTESILVVEDDDAVRRYAEAVLADAGYRVVTAPDGLTAIRRARHERVDLLLTDVIMPKLSGIELAARLDIPAVFMSGYTGDVVERHGMLGAGRRLVQKPFSAADLCRQVRAELDDAAAQPPARTSAGSPTMLEAAGAEPS